MDRRAPLGGGVQQRPRPQRAVSGGSYGSSLPKRPTLPSRLSHVRSVTQPANLVDLTEDDGKIERNRAAFLENRESLVQSPDIIKIDDDDEEPPAKRLKTTESRGKSSSDDGSGNTSHAAHELMPGSPLPSLPTAKPILKRMPGARRSRLGIEPSSRKAHGLDPPTVAARASLPPRNALDFSPWTGKPQAHAEDNLNDTVIKAGYYDKAQGVHHNESNSAKAAIWPTLSQKNHHGLSMLAYLFSAVMEKRQAIGRCTTPSTFKPPPRVTVTDTKREAWLRDLANPDIPLRKQSRTIPHGIRGKLLLEQCVSKDVPLQRAMWLAKCVGANELRAFRRKGVSGSAAASGEVKWVLDWTVSVEQFLEGIIAACGQRQGWQKNANYAVKLVTAIYTEKLMDTSHFLDWVVSRLAEASLENLPIWLALTQIFWKDMIAHGRRGRRLAKSILEHLHQVMEAESETNALLKVRLQKLVVVLAVSNRGCLIIPQVWDRYKHLLQPKPESGLEAATNTPARNITKRNERLAAPLCKTASSIRSSALDLYATLDSLGVNADRDVLADKCLSLLPDAKDLVFALLAWASTPYRTGIVRVYHASSIIANLHRNGHDTDTAILDYLWSVDSISDQSTHLIHKVVVDLIRLESFSVGRYLQWLITSGALSAAKSATCATTLIAALPTGELPRHLLNTRKTLLRRLGYDADEQTLVGQVLSSIDTASFEDVAWHFDPAVLPPNLTVSGKLSIAQEICRKTTDVAKDLGLSMTSFLLARDIFEFIGDFPALASLVSVAATSNDGALLATAADTANLHAETFAALGDFQSIMDAFAEQYLTLRSQQHVDHTFMHALASLAQRTPDRSSLVKLLVEDLAISEQQNSVAVCSPASDSLIGMQAASLNSDDDIDAVFASGNTMDEQLMQRVFTRIMQRAAKPMDRGIEPVSRVVGWLNQLRSVDGASGAFDKLVHNYLQSCFSGMHETEFSIPAIAHLSVSQSISLNAIAELSKDINTPQLADSALKMFISSCHSVSGLSACEQYRFRVQREQCQAEQADSLVTLIRTACELPAFESEDASLITFIIRCISLKPGSVRRVFEDGGDRSKVLHTNASRIITRILQIGQQSPDSEVLLKEFDVKALVRMANAFSVRYCLEAMRYLKARKNWSAEDEVVLEDAIIESFTNRSDVWAQLLDFAGERTNVTIHAWARDQLLQIATNASESVDGFDHDQLTRYLKLLAVTSRAANQNEDVAAVGVITDRLKEVETKLSQLNDVDGGPATASLLLQVHIVLDLSVVHIHAISHESDASVQARNGLLGILCSLLVHQKLQLQGDVTEYLFDLASTLSDSLAAVTDGEVKLPSSLKFPPDPRLDFILDSNNNNNGSSSTGTWLALAYQDRPHMSQQQRALAKYPSQQAHSRMPSASQQQSPTQPQHQRWPSSGSQPHLMRQDSRMMPDVKTTPYVPRKWEIFPDPTPVMGENDASLSLGLFGARKV